MLLASGPARAIRMLNGTALNGSTYQGSSYQGRTFQGLSLQGKTPQGTNLNGHSSGIRYGALQLRKIRLPDGRLLLVRP